MVACGDCSMMNLEFFIQSSSVARSFLISHSTVHILLISLSYDNLLTVNDVDAFLQAVLAHTLKVVDDYVLVVSAVG